MIQTITGFGVVSKAEVDVFLELSCSAFFYLSSLVYLYVKHTALGAQPSLYSSMYLFVK